MKVGRFLFGGKEENYILKRTSHQNYNMKKHNLYMYPIRALTLCTVMYSNLWPKRKKKGYEL